jgi:hypothetical protein
VEDLRESLVTVVEAARDAERRLFAVLDPAARDRAPSPGGWSPKDVQGHLSFWKLRQAGRLVQRREGEIPAPPGSGDTDALNAIAHAERAAWDWAAVETEADLAHARLVAEVRAIDPEMLAATPAMVDGILGNSTTHALDHISRLGREHGIRGLTDDLTRTARELGMSGRLPDSEAGTLLYNVACYTALDGDLATARALLPDAFRLRPDLHAFSLEDADLAALRAELPGLAPQ